MKSSGLADSPLFLKPKVKKGKKKDLSRHQKTMIPQDYDAMISSNHKTMVDDIAKTIQIAGTEASTFRLSKSEKKALIEIIYEFRMMNIRISENKIMRLAINYLLKERDVNKGKSILSKLIENPSFK